MNCLQPWNETIEAAKKGVILVSLGTQINCANMPEKYAKALLSVLSKLKDYQVYWSVGQGLHLANISHTVVPSHVVLMAYIPQSDLLGSFTLSQKKIKTM